MDFRHLTSFTALARTLHFGRAASELNISPSTLSRSIAQLERLVGVELLERNNRRVVLTPAGERFQQYALQALAGWDSVRQDLREGAESLHGEIRIYCSVTASYSYLHRMLTDFLGQHPRVKISLRTGDPELAPDRVRSGQEEIAIGVKPDRLPAGLSFRSLAESALQLIAAADASKGPASFGPKQLAGESLVLPERGVGRVRIDSWMREQHVSPAVAAQVAGNEAIVSMVSLGRGLGVVPQIVLDNSPLADRVRVLPLRPRLGSIEIGLFAQESRLQGRLLKTFWESASSVQSASGARAMNKVS
ncbi:MAG: HTH-type transcriptional activator IlvY [Pseudomonadota bacterium]